MRNPLSLVQKIEKITDVEKRRLFLAKFVWELPDNGIQTQVCDSYMRNSSTLNKDLIAFHTITKGSDEAYYVYSERFNSVNLAQVLIDTL